MEIREATFDDFENIVRLVPSPEELFLVYPAGTYPFTVAQLQALAAVRKELTVGVIGQELVGFANLYGLQAGHCAFIGNVVIGRSFRGEGLGRRLVDHMVHTAFKKYDLPEVRISVFSENTPALLLYASLGFKPYAVEARQHPSGRRAALIHMGVIRRGYRVQDYEDGFRLSPE
jgi:ribosomal protein S18 acetylase RimI-like enzyme